MARILGADYGNDDRTVMTKGGVMIDCFSGPVASLKPNNRTPANVLKCLRNRPLVSVWDMDTKWLRDILMGLQRAGKIEDDKKEPYPWIRYKVIE